MSTGSEEPETATSGANKNNRSTPFIKFCRWLASSIADSNNFPHYLIAIFMLGLAIFAYLAWRESQQGTAALQGQLNELRRQSALTISQLRPKLTLTFNVSKEPMKLGDKEGWVITPTWQNRGASEGIDFWGWDNAQLFTPDAPVDFDFLTLRHDAGTIPRTIIGMNDPRLQVSEVISRDEIQSIIDKKANFILWGYIEYRKSLPGNQPHHIHWCYGVRPTDVGGSWIFAYPLYRAECNVGD